MKKSTRRLILNLTPIVLGVAASIASIVADGADMKDLIEEEKEFRKEEGE